MSALQDSHHGLPKLRTSFVLGAEKRGSAAPEIEFMDVKFCQFQPLDQDPVFAAISKNLIIVCRLISNAAEGQNPCETITVIRDADEETDNFCATWSKDIETNRPLCCVGGKNSNIKVYDVVEGDVFTSLPGHGSEINDLTTSPANPLIIASCSDDTTIRIWSLDPVHRTQPCIFVLAGAIHSWALLSIAIHDSGRYLLSGGHDQLVNLWTIPDIPEHPVSAPTQVCYPHFSTSELHSGIIDNVAFYGDCILSRGVHDEAIVMWKIEGFCSADPPPPPEAAPTTYDPSRLSRSAFSTNSDNGPPRPFTRLLTFKTPGCNIDPFGYQFFLRFKLSLAPDKSPVLAFCTTTRKIYLWDFGRLLGYHEFKCEKLARPGWLLKVRNEPDARSHHTGKVDSTRVEGVKGSPNEIASYNRPSILSQHDNKTIETWEGKYSIADAHNGLDAHGVVVIAGEGTFLGRQVAWSPDGRWCIQVGSKGLCCILER